MPLNNRPDYSQSLPAPINFNDDILVELALLHKYGIITTLPFSKYASPIFAQRKPNGKLRLLVDLRKINTLIAEDYINNNHLVSTLTDAAQHLAGKNLFCKLDCSQAYHCLQMADQQSIELLAFNFASRTFAYRRLAQGLSRSLAAFSSFIREYLDPVIKADQCAQYVDNTDIAAKTPDQLIKNLRAVFQCLRNAGHKLSMAKCHFGVQKVDLLGRTITTKGVTPQKQKIANFLEKVKFPRSKKALQRYIAFLSYYRKYILRLAERLTPFFQLLKTTDTQTKIPITLDIKKEFREINEALDRCCQLALRQPLPGKPGPYDRCKLSSNWLCSANRRRSQPEVHLNTQNLRSHSLWLKNLLTIPNQNIHLRKRIFSRLHGLQRNWTYILGCHQTSDHHD